MSYDQYLAASNESKRSITNSPITINQKRLTAKLSTLTYNSPFDDGSSSNIPILSMLKGSSIDENADVSCWEFNIFLIQSENPQSWLAWKVFSEMDVFEELNIPRLQMANILLFIETNYSLVDYDSYSAYGDELSFNLTNGGPSEDNDLKSKSLIVKSSSEKLGNQYHNNLHGADVFQGVLFFSTKYSDIGGDLSSFDLFALLFAAYIHDFNHPGLNTTYMNSDWPSSGICSTFGTESPLEKHHLAKAFNLMRNVDKYNFLINCSPNKLDYFRKAVTECVIATDLAKSMAWISSSRIVIKDRRSALTNNPLHDSEGPQTNNNAITKDQMKEMEYKILLMQLSIKCADVGHPARLLHQHLEWSSRIRDEFYSQGDKERKKGMKISPLCDRNVSVSNYPQGQVGFINYVSKPCFMLLNEVVSASVEIEDEKPWLKYMNSNIQYWESKKKEEESKALLPS